MTGVDDSSLIEDKVKEEARVSQKARASVLVELASEMRGKILETVSEETSPNDLASQLSALERTIEEVNTSLKVHQENYREALSKVHDEQQSFRSNTNGTYN
ncbi:hypothetical protein [Flexibacterium corallicola]|uniref:hypothetical protein n=1 Tax=Flexibacterium corallicola TaxID=3037259 RepID=UPI00286F5065|nr:hypothetical protein [Pseudovibrio sp. M1P-2-3]